MQENLVIKEEIESPVESISECVFDNFELIDDGTRKYSCSSNDSVASLAASYDSGFGICDISEKKDSNIIHQMKQKGDSSLVQRNLELHLSSSQKENIQAILDSVQRLTDTEKLLLYLKLPAKDQERPITLSNTKQEQTLAFQWIRNNLEECDGNTNLPKHEVYDQYRSNCESQGSKRYLSAPDFGKIVKCMFPNVKARRLGTRGNSKYCYSGLRKKILKESPTLPEISASSNDEIVNDIPNGKYELDSTDQTVTAACVVICEWANKLLGRFFATIVELAKFLVGGSYVSTKSMAAFTVMSANQELIDRCNTRFGLQALLKTTGKSEMNKSAKKRSKSIKTSTPVSSPLSQVAQNVQVVPQTPPKAVVSSQQTQESHHSFELTMNVNTPVYLEETADRSQPQCSNNTHNVLLDDVTVIVNGNSFVSQSNSTNVCTNSIPSHQSPQTPKKGKKKPEKIPIPFFKPNNATDGRYCDAPNSAPPIGLRTPKKVGRPRSSKKQNSSPYPPQSPRNLGAIMSPRYGPNVPLMNVNGNTHRYPQNWPMTSPSVDNELHNIFLNSRFINTPPTLQRCHSVPVPQNNNHPTDFYQPLTPQLSSLPNAMNGGIYKAKRDLTSFFDDKSTENLHSSRLQADMSMSREVAYNNNEFQNDERLVPTSTSMNRSNLGSSCQRASFRNKETTDFHAMDDLNSILSDITNPGDLLDMPNNFEPVDSDELLKSLQTNENIWSNEWNTTTIPLLNV